MQEGLSAFGIFKDEVWQTMDFIDSAKLERIIELTIENEVWNTPTNHFFVSSFAQKKTLEELEKSPDWEILSKDVRDELLGYRESYWENPPDEKYRHKYIELRSYIIKELYNRSGRILAGSDAPEWLNLHGSGLHRELFNFVEVVGLSPYEALTTATTKPAVFLERDKLGMVKEGFEADLLLLSKNPLTDIRNINTVEGIINNGQWYSIGELNRLIDGAKRNLGSASLREEVK